MDGSPSADDAGRFELEVDGATLVGDRLDGAAPTYVYLHGRSSHRRGPRGEAVFAHAERVGRAALRTDFRGHGESGGELGATTLTQLITDLERVILPVEDPILIGSSLGGLVAAWFAAWRPQYLRAVVLLAPALGFTRAPDSPSPEGTTALGQPGGARVELHPDVVEDALRYDERDLPARLTVPLLIVHGREDSVVPFERSVDLHAEAASRTKQLWVADEADHALTVPSHGDQRRSLMPDILERVDSLWQSA